LPVGACLKKLISDPEIFIEMCCANLESPVWSCHVGGAPCSTYMAVRR